jgi:hypothetical protein
MTRPALSQRDRLWLLTAPPTAREQLAQELYRQAIREKRFAKERREARTKRLRSRVATVAGVGLVLLGLASLQWCAVLGASAVLFGVGLWATRP